MRFKSNLLLYNLKFEISEGGKPEVLASPDTSVYHCVNPN